MLTLNEAIQKVSDPRVKVQSMKPFTDDEVEGGLAYIANETLAQLQDVQEKRRNSENPFVSAAQYLYDTYEYDEDGGYDIPAENVADITLYQSVQNYNSILSDIEAKLIYSDRYNTDNLWKIYNFLKA